jgi:hypothetical protein
LFITISNVTIKIGSNIEAMKVAFKVHNSRGGKEMFKDKKTLRVAYRGKKKISRGYT